jgi:putative membrane protein
MHVLTFAKGALAAFWLLALLNLIYPMGEGWQLAVNLIAGGMLLAHVGEMLLFQARLQARPQPWLERAQVVLFGFLHLRGLPKV